MEATPRSSKFFSFAYMNDILEKRAGPPLKVNCDDFAVCLVIYDFIDAKDEDARTTFF